jgi:predicted TIM-barrel fold metal-dependent hydrolase
MLTAGMPKEKQEAFFSPKVDPLDKWRLLEPYWPAIKNTGYAQAVRITIKELYGVDELSAKTVKKIQAGYEKLRKPGFYKYVLKDKCRIESCQVHNTLPPYKPFIESQYPELLMQDISILQMIEGPDKPDWIEQEVIVKPTGINVKRLDDWHKVIDWWFSTYGKYAVAVKNPQAYFRNIDYQKVSAEKAAPIFKKIINEKQVTPEERKQLQDHLFWYTVEKATSYNLPIKFHTGYYAFQDIMPLSRVSGNPAAAADLCRLGPEHRFVFLHICYPYYEDLIAVAKHYTNAYVDMCWSWIINPVAAKDFLKKYLVTAPANKILTFGGDYGYVESVIGHAAIARWGITLALTELVEEKLLSLSDAMELIDPIMHGNAKKIFNLDKKNKILRSAEWKTE